MGRVLRKPSPAMVNRVRVVYDDGAAVFDLPSSATLADLAEALETVAEGHKTLSVDIAIDSHGVPLA
jgi:hypothetical protein